jgi:trimeric autotransporter adhesin
MNCILTRVTAVVKKSLLSLCILLVVTASHSQLISTVAGSDIGDGLAALQAGLNAPTGICFDADGNMCIADRNNHRVRRVDAVTGLVSTIAGSGTTYLVTSPVTATAANLNSPVSVTADGYGNIYICEQNNHVIRKLDVTTGIVSVFAGSGLAGFLGDNGPAFLARLNSPRWVCTDSIGNVYIADGNNNRIRKVTLATGIITTVAGNGTAGFSGDGGPATAAALSLPLGVFVDDAGNIFIAASGNNRIRKVTAATGFISTIAGTGVSGYSGDGGLATAATIASPGCVLGDSTGNLYITSNSNPVIRKINTAGIITTIAGTGIPGFSGDGGPALQAQLASSPLVFFDTSGALLIADVNNSRIRIIDPVSNIISTIVGAGSNPTGDGGLATAAGLFQPNGIFFDKAGNYYITERTGRLRKVNAVTGIITTIAGTGITGFAGDGGPAASAQLNIPLFSCMDTAGNILIADAGNSRVRKIDTATGIISTIAGTGNNSFSGDGGPAVSAGLSGLIGICTDADNNIYITGGNRIRKINAVTGIITTIAGNGTAGYSGDNGPATAALFNAPFALCTDGIGNLYVGDRNNLAVRKINLATGMVTAFLGTGVIGNTGDGGPATVARIGSPIGIAADSRDNIYVMDQSNNRIRRVDGITGIVTTVSGSNNRGYYGDGGLSTAAWIQGNGLATDTANQLYMTDGLQNYVRKTTIPLPPRYTFTGNGNWDDAGNWTNGAVPPLTLPNNAEVVIDPVPAGECVLDRAQQIKPGTKMMVKPGKKLRITGSLIITN